MKKNSSGIGVIEVLIIIVVVSIVGFAGWAVFKKTKSVSKESNTATKMAAEADSATETANTSDGNKTTTTTSKTQSQSSAERKKFTSKAGSFSLSYPSSWTTASNIENCDGEIVLLGTKESNAGKCESDAPTLVLVARTSTNTEQWFDISNAADQYTDLTSTEVTVDGIKGVQTSGTYTGNNEGLGPQVGANIINYHFVKDGYTYYAVYTQNPGDPDESEEFKYIVTKTLDIK